MNYLTLELPQKQNINIKSSSFLTNFPDISIFYFSIPEELSESEQTHLINFGKLFFESQTTNDIHQFLRIHKEENIINTQNFYLQISWEIFYQFQHQIIVKSNVFDDYLKCDISGAKGKIINFFSGDNQDIYQIQFSNNSLKHILKNQTKRFSKEISPFFTYLESELFMPDFPLKGISKENYNMMDFLPDILEGDLLIEELDDTFKKTMDNLEFINIWEMIFNQFFMEEIEIITIGSNQRKYSLIGINSSDESFGVWGEFRNDSKISLFPLTDMIKCLNQKKFDQYLQIYRKISKLILPN